MNKRKLVRKIVSCIYLGIFLFGVCYVLREILLENSASSECSSREDFKLSHVIIPFHMKQLERVLETVRKWSKYKPCLKKTKSQMPEILFYLGYSDDTVDLNRVRDVLGELKPHLECFSNGDRIDLVDLKLSDTTDNRIYGSNAMFENLLARNHTMFSSATYVFYVEADARPIRSDWLEALDREIGWNRFWIRGCSYTGDNPIDIHHTRDLMYAFHWNGNALYNLADDAFREFYFKTLKPYAKPSSHQPYDWHFIKYILDENNWRTSTRILHRFQYTDVIVNTYALLHRQYTLDAFIEAYPHTYFSHRFVPTDY